jgi:3-oxoacyl-[acyl-carrier protein] reductase
LKLEGKVAVVTGASRGIGRSIAVHFAAEGAKLAISGRDPLRLGELRDELRAKGNEVLSILGDASSERDVVKLIESTVEAFGRIDILVNNAGFGIFKPVIEMKTEEFDSLFSVNMRGAFIATREALRHMIAQNDGVIINIASLAGKNAIENGAAYAATKWAMIGFAKSVMLEVRKHNIRIVTICPGSVDTDFGFSNRSNRDRILKPKDVAEAAVLAASLPATAMMSEIDLRPTNPKG